MWIRDNLSNACYRKISTGTNYFGRLQVYNPVTYTRIGTTKILLRKLILLCWAVFIDGVGTVNEYTVSHANSLVDKHSCSSRSSVPFAGQENCKLPVFF